MYLTLTSKVLYNMSKKRFGMEEVIIYFTIGSIYNKHHLVIVGSHELPQLTLFF